MMKKLGLRLLALSLSASAVCGMTACMQSYKNGFSYDINQEEKTCTLSRYKGSETEIVIPDKYNGYSVTGIGWSAFSIYSTDVTSVTIPDSVITIGRNAFAGCHITELHLGKNVEVIEYSAFDRTDITALTIPDSVKIMQNAFSNCKSLKTVTIGSGLEVIDAYTFLNCEALEEVTFGANITTFEWYAFNDCNHLKTVNYTGEIEDWLAINFERADANPLYKGGELKIDGERVTELVLDENVTEIKPYVFYSNPYITSLTALDGVEKVGKAAFVNCDALTSVTLHNLSSIDAKAFLYCQNLTSVSLGGDITSIGANAFMFCEKLENVYFQGNVSEWERIEKGEKWNHGIPATKVVCLDGEVAL